MKLIFLIVAATLVGCTHSSDSSPSGTSGGGGGRGPGAKANGVDGSFLTKCLSNGKRLLITFAPEGNFVDEYSPCARQATKTRLPIAPVAIGKPDPNGGLSVSLSGYELTTVQSSSVDTYYGEGDDFYVKWSGQCNVNGTLGACSELYYFLQRWPDEDHFPDINWVASNPGGSYGEDWVTSSLYRDDWRKGCTHFEKVTVAAGRFNSCVVENADFKVWLGQTPLFQVIKIVNKTGAIKSDGGDNWPVYLGIHNWSGLQTYELTDMSW